VRDKTWLGGAILLLKERCKIGTLLNSIEAEKKWPDAKIINRKNKSKNVTCQLCGKAIR